MKILSISIAAYNVEPYLDDILNKFLMVQNNDKIEVIIVNDGSSDNTSKIASKFVKSYPNLFKLIDKSNGGWGSTVNVSIQEATGKYYKLLDGDDYYNIDNMPGFIDFLENSTSDMIITPYRLFNDSTGAVYPKKNNREEFSYQGLFGLKSVHGLFSMHEVCFKLSILKNKPMNISINCFYTDVEYVAKGMCRVSTIEVYPFEIYMYRIAREGQSDSLAGRTKHYKDHLHVIRVLAEFRKEFASNTDEYRLISERLHSMIKRQCNIFLSIPASKHIKQELIEYDKWTKKSCPDLYGETSRTMKIIRKTNYKTYFIIAAIVRKHENKKEH